MFALFSLDQSRLRSEDVLCCFIIIIIKKNLVQILSANFIYQRQRERDRVGVQWAKKEKNKLYLLFLLPRPLKKLGLRNYNPILQLHSIPVEVNSLFFSLLLYCLVFRVFFFVYLST
jgi:hypothetical protein